MADGNFSEWYNSLSKPEKRIIALIWLSIQICDDMLKNPIYYKECKH